VLSYAEVMALEPEPDTPQVDDSHDLDLVGIFASSNHDAEMEALAIHSLLQANGIPSVMVGPSTIPSLEFQVRVPRQSVEEAQRVLDEAKAAGPEAAVEAEQQSESEGTV
jgi:hypothetical protein